MNLRSSCCPLIFLLLPVTCLAQGGPEVLTQGSIVTGQCTNSGDPGCVLPNLFGNQGLTLPFNQGFTHYAHFASSAQATLNTTLSTAIATQLVSLPFVSPASGYTYRYDRATGAFVRTSSSFGPIYTERATTIGRGKFTFGVNYQAFNFSSLDGISLKDLPVVYGHEPNTQPPNFTRGNYEADVISTGNNINLSMNQTVLYGTVGLTDRLDVSVSIPFVTVSMAATANASIQRISGLSVSVPQVNNGVPFNPHQFDTSGGTTKTYVSNGSSGGIGDITVRIKGNLFRNDNWGLSAAVDIRSPTGDARSYTGAGAAGFKPFIILSGTKGRWTPHLNLGYQWNGSSILASNVTGSVFGENSSGQTTITNGPVNKASLPNLFFYSLGTDVGVSSRLTLVFDYLGQEIFNAPRVMQSTQTYKPFDTSIQNSYSTTLPTVTGVKQTMALNNGSVGAKINLGGRVLLTANMLFRLNSAGLRQNVTPLLALSYAFGN